MECPSCGALIESGIEQCSQCAAGARNENADVSGANVHATDQAPQASKLIEFPGVTRSTVPLWRKELSDRVREVQEKRAREESLELSLDTKTVTATREETPPQLELLPQAEASPVNPLVVAALKRIERAHETPAYVGRSSQVQGGASVAYAAPMMQAEVSCEVATQEMTIPEYEEPREIEKARNLVIVPPTPTPSASPNITKPKRMIGDINDPALNYLDSVTTVAHFETSTQKRASIRARIISACVDVVVLSLLCTPFAAALELTNANWQAPRTWILGLAIFSIVGFLYFTIATALSGRTFGLKLFSLRVVDVRTGLIPTGTQSAGRALIYLASLLVLGITSVFALFNPERLTPHDRITRTAVVQG